MHSESDFKPTVVAGEYHPFGQGVGFAIEDPATQ